MPNCDNENATNRSSSRKLADAFEEIIFSVISEKDNLIREKDNVITEKERVIKEKETANNTKDETIERVRASMLKYKQKYSALKEVYRIIFIICKFLYSLGKEQRRNYQCNRFFFIFFNINFNIIFRKEKVILEIFLLFFKLFSLFFLE